MGVPPEFLGYIVELGVNGIHIDLDAELFLARGQICNGDFHGNLIIKTGDSGH